MQGLQYDDGVSITMRQELVAVCTALQRYMILVFALPCQSD